MKTISFIILFSSLSLLTVSAQSVPAKEAFSISAITAPHKQSGKINYLLALSAEDFQNKQYVFYTDSNARVAHIIIDGKNVRLTGGPNAEHIMAYTNGSYTVTLHNTTGTSKNAIDSKGYLTTVTTLAVYNKMGKVVVKQVTGNQVK